MKITIGIDPDSKAHGVAIYENDKLTRLECFTLIQLMELFNFNYENELKNITIHIEDVLSMNAVFAQRQKRANWNTHGKMANSIGKCQQSQVELERLFEYLGLKVVKHKISKAWKKDKKQFELFTGWKSRSNEDTRSAAYFGYLGLTHPTS